MTHPHTDRTPWPRSVARLVATSVVVVLALGACGDGTTTTTTATTAGTTTAAPSDPLGDDDADDLSGQVVVSAAASLTDAFGVVEAAFEDAHPDVDVVLNLAGSSALREQVLAGAPVDVFASANTDNMDQVVEAGAVAGEPRVFATNLLQIAVPPGNPGNVGSLEDFGDDDLLLGLCAPAVPCGDFARAAMEGVGVTPAIDTNEPDVRALLTKIEVDELDAGITYVTDVASTDGAVEGIDIPDEDNVVATYPVAVLTQAPNPATARAFVAFVLSPAGQGLLAESGFSPPRSAP